MTSILTEAEILHDMVTRCLALQDSRKTTHWGAVKCEECERAATVTCWSNGGEYHYCAEHTPSYQDDGGLSDQAHAERQYNKYGPDGGV